MSVLWRRLCKIAGFQHCDGLKCGLREQCDVMAASTALSGTYACLCSFARTAEQLLSVIVGDCGDSVDVGDADILVEPVK